MKKICTVFFLFICVFGHAQDYDSLMGPKVWLRADLSELSSGKWTDVGFFKNHAPPLSKRRFFPNRWQPIQGQMFEIVLKKIND